MTRSDASSYFWSPVDRERSLISSWIVATSDVELSVLHFGACPLAFLEYTQYELYGTGYMGHFFGLVEIYEKIRDVTSL